MTNNIWFISDTHFFHKNILTFNDNEGKLMRPQFSSIEEMNEVIADNWRKVVKPHDKVYHLGDVTMHYGPAFDIFFKSLPGKKRLCVGNHDDVKKLAPYFEKIMLWRIFKAYKDWEFVATHVPLHPKQFRYAKYNVHGHIHCNNSDSPQHLNISVEKTDYQPVHIDEIVTRCKRQEKDSFDLLASQDRS